MKRGAREKITPELTKAITNAIRIGMTIERAASFCGISKVTFYNWKQRGENEKKGKYADFLNALKKAESEGIGVHLSHLNNAASDGQWQAAAWILERRHPNEYGRNIIAEPPEEIDDGFIDALNDTAREVFDDGE